MAVAASRAIISGIQQLSKMVIEQWFFKTEFPSNNVRLHVFADTSTRTYGVVTYLASDNDMTLVMAKTVWLYLII